MLNREGSTTGTAGGRVGRIYLRANASRKIPPLVSDIIRYHPHRHQMQSMLLEGLLIALTLVTASAREGRRKVFSEHVPVPVAEVKDQMVKNVKFPVPGSPMYSCAGDNREHAGFHAV